MEESQGSPGSQGNTVRDHRNPAGIVKPLIQSAGIFIDFFFMFFFFFLARMPPARFEPLRKRYVHVASRQTKTHRFTDWAIRPPQQVHWPHSSTFGFIYNTAVCKPFSTNGPYCLHLHVSDFTSFGTLNLNFHFYVFNPIYSWKLWRGENGSWLPNTQYIAFEGDVLAIKEQIKLM